MPSWWYWVFDLAILGFVAAVGLLAAIWISERGYRNRMVAEIRGADGFKRRTLVKVQDNGKTVEVNRVTYMLPREKEEGESLVGIEDVDDELGDKARLKKWKERHPDEEEELEGGKVKYPIKNFVRWPILNIFGWTPFYVTLRIEEWQEDNPEPLRPYDGELYATGAEITSMKNEAQAVAAASMAIEAEQRQKQLERTIAQMPSKMVVYFGLIAVGLIGIISLIYIYGIKGAVGG